MAIKTIIFIPPKKIIIALIISFLILNSNNFTNNFTEKNLFSIKNKTIVNIIVKPVTMDTK
ncbi:hypothetical protein D3052_09440 [Campylobacter coli]|nr:hypothetical protein [Campylobacter coli]